ANRELQPTTVLSHIASLYLDRRIDDFNGLVLPDEVEKVERIVEDMSTPYSLKAIHEALDREIAYGKIRLALAVIERID
ncbi:MAG: helix-turn-helix domain-containing protein, partial [Flavobacteriales bacterium]|nr:helix-turn-helix domain-containing protein [Flavobacteriales bacterium]